MEGGQLTLNAKVSISKGTMTYKWSPSTGLNSDDILNPITHASDIITYFLTATSDKKSSLSVQLAINVLKLPIIPTASTPNGDGINETWNLANFSAYPNATFEIFNRSGQRLFYFKNYPVPWDGRYNGTDVPAGIYYYVINPKSGRKAMLEYVVVIK